MMEKQPLIQFTETPKWLCFKQTLCVCKQADLIYPLEERIVIIFRGTGAATEMQPEGLKWAVVNVLFLDLGGGYMGLFTLQLYNHGLYTFLY